MGEQFPIWIRLILAVAVCLGSVEPGVAQTKETKEIEKSASKKKDDGVAVIRGQVAFDENQSESWDGNRLTIPYEEIEGKIRQRVVPPPPPYPAGYKQWDREKLIQWELEFIKTKAGKKFVEDRRKLIQSAHVFDVKFEKDGKFVIYDVPYGVYGIQSRIDKEINGKKYAFEVFGEIPVEKGMDEIPLNKMRVEVSPLIQQNEIAPPVDVKTSDDEKELNLKQAAFKDKMVFVNFWSTKSPTAVAEQKMIQDMFVTLRGKHPIELVSICVDQDKEKALEFIEENDLEEGTHGFSSGLDHRTIFDFGVRSFPSYWLIGADGKVMMTQFEVARQMRLKSDMKTIVEDRILGKEVPTPAEPSDQESKEK